MLELTYHGALSLGLKTARFTIQTVHFGFAANNDTSQQRQSAETKPVAHRSCSSIGRSAHAFRFYTKVLIGQA